MSRIRSQNENQQDINRIRDALHNYSTWFVDWEEMHFNPAYKPEFPKDLIEAEHALKRIEQDVQGKFQ